MLRNKNLKLLYIAHPRTGSNSIRTVLQEWGFEPCGRGDHDYTIPTGCHTYKTIVGIRLHESIVKSWCIPRNLEEPPPIITPEVVRQALKYPVNNGWADIHSMFPQFNKWTKHIIRFESLQADLDSLARILVRRPIEAPHINSEWSDKGKGLEFTPEAREYVRGRFLGEWERMVNYYVF